MSASDMSQTEMAARSRQLQASEASFTQMIGETRAASATDGPAERPPVASAVGSENETETKETGGGGCGGSFMKIFLVIVAVVVSVVYPPAAPVMAAVVGSQLAPEPPQGESRSRGVSQEYLDKRDELLNPSDSSLEEGDLASIEGLASWSTEYLDSLRAKHGLPADASPFEVLEAEMASLGFGDSPPPLPAGGPSVL